MDVDSLMRAEYQVKISFQESGEQQPATKEELQIPSDHQAPMLQQHL